MCAAIPGDLPSVAGHMTLLAKRNLIFDLSIKTKMNFCRTSHSQRYCCFGYPGHGKKNNRQSFINQNIYFTPFSKKDK